MKILPDGTIVESQLGATSTDHHHAQQNAWGLQAGQIHRVLPIDHENNLSKQFVEYDVEVVNQGTNSILYRNARTLDDFGGRNNFNEVTLPPNITQWTGGASHAHREGAHVIIGCFNGQRHRAVILRGFQHTGVRDNVSHVPALSSIASPDSTIVDLPTKLPGATQDDGQRILGEFNGLRWNIDKDGQFTMLFQGPKDKNGKLISNKGPLAVNLNSNGEFNIYDRAGQAFEITPTSGIVIESSTDTFLELKGVKKHTATLAAGKQAVVDSPSILLGKSAIEPAILGQTLVQILTQAFSAIIAGNIGMDSITSAPVAIDPTVKVAIQIAITQLQTALSQVVHLE